MNEPLFAKRALVLVVGVTSVSFVLAVLLAIFGTDLIGIKSHRSDAYSHSAIGHLALIRTLRALDIPVYVSTWESARRAGRSGVLLVLEPPVEGNQWGNDEFPDRQVRDMLETARTSLVSLPKWGGPEHEDVGGWIGPVLRKGDWAIQDLFRDMALEARVVQIDEGTKLDWRMGGFGPPPELRDVQLIQSDEIDPIVDCDEGILIGELRYGDNQNRVVLISDPDLFSNHGLGRGGNAIIAVRLIEHLRLGGGVVVDETSHGFEYRPTIFREAFRFPLSIVSLQLVFCLGMLLWAGMGRFGSPSRPPPPLDPGNRFLIHNTAELLRYGGHTQTMLSRYLDDTVADVRQKLHIAEALDDDALLATMARLESSRKTRIHYRDLATEVDALTQQKERRPERVVRAARRIHDWKREILNGPGGGSQGT